MTQFILGVCVITTERIKNELVFEFIDGTHTHNDTVNWTDLCVEFMIYWRDAFRKWLMNACSAPDAQCHSSVKLSCCDSFSQRLANAINSMHCKCDCIGGSLVVVKIFLTPCRMYIAGPGVVMYAIVCTRCVALQFAHKSNRWKFHIIFGVSWNHVGEFWVSREYHNELFIQIRNKLNFSSLFGNNKYKKMAHSISNGIHFGMALIGDRRRRGWVLWKALKLVT